MKSFCELVMAHVQYFVEKHPQWNLKAIYHACGICGRRDHIHQQQLIWDNFL